MKNKNGHETDLEMSPRPLGTTIFEEIYESDSNNDKGRNYMYGLSASYEHFLTYVGPQHFQKIRSKIPVRRAALGGVRGSFLTHFKRFSK